MHPPIGFVIPGDPTLPTGGYIFDAELLARLPALGQPVWRVLLPGGFPHPTPAEMAETARILHALPPGMPLLIDGLALGAMDPQLVTALRAPIIALVHHPLGLEAGLEPARADALLATERANLAQACAVLVTSDHTAGILVRDFAVPAAKITVALPGFDRPQITEAKARPPLILSVGSLIRRKGHDVLLNALGVIRDLDWQAVIIGKALDPVYSAELEAQRTALGLQRRVHLAGGLPGQAVADHFARAHLFALATRYEGFGMALAEAQLHGLPVVSCRVGAVVQTVPDEAGILTPPDETAAFAAALRALLEDARMHAEFSAGARAAGARLPDWDDTARIALDPVGRVHAGIAPAAEARP